MTEINIDATNAILGRLASYAAKQALLGHTVNVLNCEKTIISGRKNKVKEDYHHQFFQRGRPEKGPFISRIPDRLVRRTIRGMLDYKHGRGEEAYHRIMCYLGIPVKFNGKKLIKTSKEAKDLPTTNYQSMEKLCASLGRRS